MIAILKHREYNKEYHTWHTWDCQIPKLKNKYDSNAQNTIQILQLALALSRTQIEIRMIVILNTQNILKEYYNWHN